MKAKHLDSSYLEGSRKLSHVYAYLVQAVGPHRDLAGPHSVVFEAQMRLNAAAAVVGVRHVDLRGACALAEALGVIEGDPFQNERPCWQR